MSYHNFQPPMHPEFVVCPKCGDEAQGRIGIHSHQERRYICHQCSKTFAETVGTPLYGLKHPSWLVIIVLTLLAYGCPIPAIVLAFGLDERTVAAWQQKAGEHAKVVQQKEVCSGKVDLGQVQGDELYLKSQHGAAWVATAMTVFSRLFIWGAVSVERNTSLVSQVVSQVRAAALPGRPILWLVDGFAGWTHAIKQRFRQPLYSGKPGRPRLLLWPELHIVQVVKRLVGRRLAGIERRLVHGSYCAAEAIMMVSQVNLGRFNTAYIERLNATFRTWLPALTRRSRTPSRRRRRMEAALFWTGSVYNFCHVHASLDGTPAMAADLTDHVWSVRQLLFCYRFRREALHAIL
jgi:transposase-like protein